MAQCLPVTFARAHTPQSNKGESSAVAQAGPLSGSRGAEEQEHEGYAEPGYAEHKGPKHLEEHWRKGRGGLRPEDYEEEEARLRELQQSSKGGLASRAAAAVAAVASALPLPAAVAAYLKRTPSAAELAQESEGYAEPGLSEHKGPKHLEDHWRKGRGGLREGGEDVEEEEARLREMHEKQGKGLVQRAKESLAAAAGGALQGAKEMVGLAPPRTGEPGSQAEGEQKPQ